MSDESPPVLSLIAGQVEMVDYAGAAFQRVVTIKCSDGSLFDLTNLQAALQIVLDGAPLTTLTTANGKITNGGTAGTLTLNFDATDIEEPVDKAQYDLLLYNPSNGWEQAIIGGYWSFVEPVTQVSFPLS